VHSSSVRKTSKANKFLFLFVLIKENLTVCLPTYT
jgi:hypothetical protein